MELSCSNKMVSYSISPFLKNLKDSDPGTEGEKPASGSKEIQLGSHERLQELQD
jgi:hypothetical protein